FEACRYNGHVIPDTFVRTLEPYVIYKKVCPEVKIGLGIPRNPVKIIIDKDKKKLFQPESGNDLTRKINKFSKKFISSLKSEVDGFILKSRSPSCGLKDAKIYESKGTGSVVGKTSGFFATNILESHPGLAIEDEGRLRNFNIRDHFLSKLFTLTKFRHAKNKNSINELIRFHTSNKFLFMAYNQKELRNMGKLLGDYNNRNFQVLKDNYEQNLHKCLSKMPRKTSFINALMHALGYFSKKLHTKEKAFFLEQLEDYRNNRIPISALLSVLRVWSVKYEEKYLLQQTFFEPFPKDLMDVSDSGKGRTL
ncbi:MAG: DUF1722 domain-containing protein, partial [Candidatus Dadabacteria bacterium]|nr:DUF1722 domain-containing protein [Candidatus Dadabacteria bacterium]NIT13356.1 DUF1722 domain-containing protein [Candidatus Dadabacteria bacterium]